MADFIKYLEIQLPIICVFVAANIITGADVKCLDKWPFCYRYTPPCDNETQNVHEVCSRRCELCEPNTSDNESCIDKVDCTLYNLSHGCKSNNWFREYCPSSCGFCSDVPGDHVAEIWRWNWISASIILALSVIFFAIVILRRYKSRKDSGGVRSREHDGDNKPNGINREQVVSIGISCCKADTTRTYYLPVSVPKDMEQCVTCESLQLVPDDCLLGENRNSDYLHPVSTCPLNNITEKEQLNVSLD